MNVRDSYEQWAATYDADRNLTRDLDGEMTRKLLGGGPFGRVVELGCGTGKNTEFFAETAGAVTALDFSPAMIAQAAGKPGLEQVHFTLADLTKPWPVAAGAFELVAGNLVLEHIADLAFIFQEAARVLTPDGRLFLSELHPFRQYQGSVARFERADATISIPASVHHVSDFLAAATAAGFRLVDLGEWWHRDDTGKPPRLLTLIFSKK